MTGTKHDAGKLRYDLVPDLAEREWVSVLTFGAAKYGAGNWRELPEWRARYFAALRRHLSAWRAGQARDEESTLHHLAHAMCCVAFLLEKELQELAERPP